jgi:predicted RNA-binding protein with PIN domain
MQKYIIDGNNLIGKIKSLQKLQQNDKQAVREKLVFIVERYFHKRKFRVSLHFDGYPGESLKISAGKIIYSQNRTADEKIKDEIASFRNPINLIVVTSDNNLKEFAQVCSCKIISSEEFSSILYSQEEKDEEEERIKSINDVEEFKRIFGEPMKGQSKKYRNP